MLELERVGDGGDHVGIAAADLNAVAEVPGRGPRAEQVVGRSLRWRGPCDASQQARIGLAIGDFGWS